jgi:hypothetical protein
MTATLNVGNEGDWVIGICSFIGREISWFGVPVGFSDLEELGNPGSQKL